MTQITNVCLRQSSGLSQCADLRSDNAKLRFPCAERTLAHGLNARNNQVAYDAAAGIIKHYRVDKMQNIEILETDRKGEDSFKNFDLAAFAKKTFGMYGGVDAEVTLELNITLRRSRLSGVARATLPDRQSHLVINYCIMF